MLLPNSRQIIEPYTIKKQPVYIVETGCENHAKSINMIKINVIISLRLISILKLDSIRIGIPPFFKISLIWDFSRQQIYTVHLAGHTCTEMAAVYSPTKMQYH